MNSGQDPNVLEQLDTGVVRLGPGHRVQMMNSAAEACLLVSRDRAQGQPIGDIAHLPPELGEAIAQISGGNQSIRLHELRLGNGVFDCTIKSIEGEDLLLEFQNLEWEQMRFRLQQREIQTGMLNLLSRNLGHEVRNPLGGIRGAAQMLADELKTGDLATLARLIMRESDRIDDLTRRFGQPELDLAEVDLYPLIDEALDLLIAEFGDSIAIERDFDPSIPSIAADGAAIRQILLNLFRNACQAGASVVLITTRVEFGSALLQNGQGGVIRLQVIDNGQGVPESLQSLLFLPLVTGRRDGTGMGLALSQQIASAHGGLLIFEPIEQGSCFSLLLPINTAPGNSLPEKTS